MSFLKSVLATIVGLVLFFVLGFLFMVSIIGALSSTEKPTISENSILFLNLQGLVSERVADDPLQDILPQSAPLPIGLLSLLETIENASTDDRIKGIYMEHSFLSAGASSLREIRNALIEFKAQDKFIISYGEYMSEADYYLASVADELHLNPEGFVEFNGLSANISFFKGTFEKLGIEPQIFRVGDFKSAVEPFMLKKMSEENKLQVSSFLGGIFDVFIGEIAKSRNVEESRMREISDQMLVRLPEDALTYGLVDKLSYKDEVRKAINEKLGNEEDAKIKSITHGDYSKSLSLDGGEYSKNRIAVIVATGEIVSGSGDFDNIGGDKFAREIRKARENDRVKAIVLRINSPGGSLTGSDVIWREIMLTKGVKPVIASMSDVAASGGYFIAMPCDTIVAQPNTITGSIGIFGMLFNMENFLEDKLGITHDVVSTGTYSDIYTVTRPLSSAERRIIQQGVDKGYETFTTKAAEGRNMQIDDLLEVASGRVWTGQQAYERGLVDVIGSFEDAIQLAVAAAELEEDDYRVSFYPPKENIWDQILNKGQNEADIYLQSKAFGDLAPYVKEIKSLEKYKGIQARLPYQFTIN